MNSDCRHTQTSPMPRRAVDDGCLTLTEILALYRQEGKRLAPANIISLARAILEGLSQLHKNGLIYGCLTPNDIVLSDQAAFCLLEPSRTGETWVDGNYDDIRSLYMAPEALVNGDWNAASDVFSVGVVLGQCLLGQHPFRYHHDQSLQDVHWHIAYEPPLLSPLMLEQHDDKGLLALVYAMLIKEPQLRPSAEELLIAIKTRKPMPLMLPPGDTADRLAENVKTDTDL